jgi:hypothetical protein
MNSQTDSDSETDSSETDEPWCIVLYSEETPLKEGMDITIPIPVPDACELKSLLDEKKKSYIYICEEGTALCSDNKDNDGDGKMDCDDPDCIEPCAESADGGLSNPDAGASGAIAL